MACQFKVVRIYVSQWGDHEDLFVADARGYLPPSSDEKWIDVAHGCSDIDALEKLYRKLSLRPDVMPIANGHHPEVIFRESRDKEVFPVPCENCGVVKVANTLYPPVCGNCRTGVMRLMFK